MSKEDDFINDLKLIFKEHDVFMSVTADYDGQDNYCGETVEIKSKNIQNGRIAINIYDLKELSEKLT